MGMPLLLLRAVTRRAGTPATYSVPLPCWGSAARTTVAPPSAARRPGIVVLSTAASDSGNHHRSRSEHQEHHRDHNRRHYRRHRHADGEGDGARRSSDGSLASTTRWRNAHSVLGVDVGCSLDEARRAFVGLALRLHPDQLPPDSSNTSKTSRAADHDEFVKVRSAYETIRAMHEKRRRQGPATTGPAHPARESPDAWNEEALHHWYREETGDDYCPVGLDMNESTRKEVANVHHHMNPGGLDRGGMWEMARLVAESSANGGREGDNDDDGTTNSRSPVRRLLAGSSSSLPAPTSTEVSGFSRRRKRG